MKQEAILIPYHGFVKYTFSIHSSVYVAINSQKNPKKQYTYKF